MRTIEQNIYKFNELSDDAKDVARNWWKSCDDFDHEYIYDYAKECAGLFGLDVDRIEYSGFYHQGSGCAFKGDYKYKAGALKAVMQECPWDSELHKIVKALQDVQRKAFYKLECHCYNASHHYFTQACEMSGYFLTDFELEMQDALAQCMSDFADWIYSRLEKEYEYTQSNEYADECIIANDYEFFENGERA